MAKSGKWSIQEADPEKMDESDLEFLRECDKYRQTKKFMSTLDYLVVLRGLGYCKVRHDKT